MAFPREVIRLSELVADKITGALYKTVETGDRIEIGPGKNLPGTERTEIRFATDSVNERAPAVIRRYNPDSSGLGANQIFYLQNAIMDGLDSSQFIEMLTTYNHHPINRPDRLSIHSDLVTFEDSSGGVINAEVRINALAMPGMVGTALKAIRLFFVNATVAGANGDAIVNHGMGVTPDGFMVFVSNATFPYLPTAVTGSRTTTQFTCRLYHNVTGALAPAGTGLSGYAIAWATQDQSNG